MKWSKGGTFMILLILGTLVIGCNRCINSKVEKAIDKTELKDSYGKEEK